MDKIIAHMPGYKERLCDFFRLCMQMGCVVYIEDVRRSSNINRLRSVMRCVALLDGRFVCLCHTRFDSLCVLHVDCRKARRQAFVDLARHIERRFKFEVEFPNVF